MAETPAQGEPRCPVLAVPSWYVRARERIDLEARGFVDVDRTYAQARIDAAVSDSVDLIRATLAKRAQDDEIARVTSGGAHASAEHAARVQRNAGAFYGAAQAAQGVTQ